MHFDSELFGGNYKVKAVTIRDPISLYFRRQSTALLCTVRFENQQAVAPPQGPRTASSAISTVRDSLVLVHSYLII
jgi:hypothetical protein